MIRFSFIAAVSIRAEVTAQADDVTLHSGNSEPHYNIS